MNEVKVNQPCTILVGALKGVEGLVIGYYKSAGEVLVDIYDDVIQVTIHQDYISQ